jgi:hypothetical protein
MMSSKYTVSGKRRVASRGARRKDLRRRVRERQITYFMIALAGTAKPTMTMAQIMNIVDHAQHIAVFAAAKEMQGELRRSKKARSRKRPMKG